MRYPIFLFLFAFLLFSISGCNNSSNNPPVSDFEQFAWVESYIGFGPYASVPTELYDAQSGIYGEVFANPIPAISSYDVNSSLFNGYQVEMGYVKFGKSLNNTSLAFATSTVHLTTSIGTLTATLPRPDTITTLTSSVIDSARINSPVTLTWTGPHCDFYYCNLLYQYVDSSGWVQSKGLDTVVTGTSVTIPGTFFDRDGYVILASLVTGNGKLPLSGGIGNLSGTGTGYYFYTNMQKRANVQFPVGHGQLHSSTTLANSTINAHDHFHEYIHRHVECNGTNTISSGYSSASVDTSIATPQFVIATALIGGIPGGPYWSFYYGEVFASRMPAVELFKLNNNTFYHSDPDMNQWFQNGFGIYQENLNLATPTIAMQVTTSIGTVSGTLTKPDTITSFQCMPSDTLQIGHPLTVSWSGGHADFYYVRVQCDYSDTATYFIDTLVVGNTVTFDGALFQYNGDVFVNRPTSINGPFPQVGATTNMTGNGSGFFYYINELAGPPVFMYVGNYLSTTRHAPTPPVSRDHILTTIQKALGVESAVIATQ